MSTDLPVTSLASSAAACGAPSSLGMDLLSLTGVYRAFGLGLRPGLKEGRDSRLSDLGRVAKLRSGEFRALKGRAFFVGLQSALEAQAQAKQKP